MIEQNKSQSIGPSRQTVLGLPVDRAILFSNERGIYKQRIARRQTKLLEKITFLRPFLKEGEKILLVTTGCSPVSFLEQFLAGWIIFYLKRSLFVFTDKRIFHIPTKANYTYRNSIAQILYSDCEKITMKGGTLSLQYENGQRERFNYLAGRERKRIKALLEKASPAEEGSRARGRTYLCPSCAKELGKEQYTCPNCRLVFKDKAQGKRISILYPGGGYFYTGHPFLGIGDAVTEFGLIVLVVVSAIDLAAGAQGGATRFILFGFALVLEKAISVYHSNHFLEEDIPREREIKPRIGNQ